MHHACTCSQCMQSEEESNFWADVYYYMQENNCDEKTAIQVIEPLYKNQIVS
jgi:hypothetical protein